ncbi:MAG: TIM barrel protein [Sedimentisphaerales bacterium]|nr:TIM barrel protein [Sedimentisphaerales bacterium]
MDRRIFLATSLAAGAGAAAVAVTPSELQGASAPGGKFKMKYAPHFGMFRNHAGKDLIDQLKFAADQGFTAWEDNNMMKKPVDLQEKIAKTMTKLGITMGVFVSGFTLNEKTLVKKDKATREMLVKGMKKSVEVAKRVNAKWTTVVPGAYDNKLEWDYQTANVIENLKWCSEVCEPSGLVMVLEPLNWWTNHAGCFLSKIPQAYMICKAVSSPSCKILDDLYHQQITEGNLIPNINMAWDEIAYFQMGDNPGRKEPTTGEINYKNIFKHIHRKGFKGIMGMEHGNSKKGKEGELAVIRAYRECDNF